VTIIVPTRRARLKLAEAFARQGGGAVLLPDIRTFGGEAGEEEPFLPPFDVPPTPPVASALERRLTLSHLVRAFAEGSGSFATPPNAAEVFWLADSLGTLIDDIAIEAVQPEAFRTLVPEDLAGNWQQILGFLDVVLKGWPAILSERGKLDAAVARNARLHRQATPPS
jgi:ATP-dependent helicase/nuclease subunit B